MRQSSIRARLFAALALSLLSAPAALCDSKNFQTLSSWDNVCADGKIFYPGYSKDPAHLRDDVRQYRKHPDSEGWWHRAAAYYLRYRASELPAFCTDALKRYPNWTAPHYWLGKFHEASMDDDKAIAEYKKAIELKPCFGWASMQCSALYYKSGEHQEAINIADSGLKYCQDSKDLASADAGYYLLQTKAKALMALKKNKEAADTLEKAAKLHDGHPDKMVLNQLSEVYGSMGQWSKAIAATTASIKIDPKEAAPYLYRGKAYAVLKRNQQALDDISVYISKHTGDPSLEVQQARQLRAVLYERLGKKDLATKERQSVQSGLKDLYKNTPFRSDRAKGESK